MTVNSDSAKFSRALYTAILWPVGIILVTALLLLVYTLVLFEMVSWSDHSYQVLAQARKCENILLATQNDVRAYLLTGDPDFVKSYETGNDTAEKELADLKRLVSDSSEQSIHADDLIQSRLIWRDHAKTMIAQRSPENPANPDWVRMGEGIMDNIERKFDVFAATEVTLRDQRLHQVRRMKMVLAYSGSALVVLLALSVAYVVRKQMIVLAGAYREALDTIELRHTALRRSESDLEEQKERLRVTLTSIGDGVIVTDPEGRIVLMNHEAERLTGWANSEALHQPLSAVFNIINEMTRQIVADPVAKVLKEKRIVGLANHTVLLSRTAEEWPIEDSAAPINDAGGNILGVVMVFHDATETRVAQKSLLAHSVELERVVADRTLALQQTVSELETFSYTVSHDLRSPLRAMQGFSEAIMEDYGDKLDLRGKDYLERIQNAAKKLDRLIQDLLVYTRISRQDIPLEALDLDKVVRDIIENDDALKPPAASIRIDGTLPKILGRDTALNQVVVNLLGNAVKFVPTGAVPQIRIWSEDLGNRMRLWVEDNGLGIQPRDQERIFNMFVQVNDASTYGGTGVGLAIVKKAMQTMHGTAGVESADGAGSRFWVELSKAA